MALDTGMVCRSLLGLSAQMCAPALLRSASGEETRMSPPASPLHPLVPTPQRRPVTGGDQGQTFGCLLRAVSEAQLLGPGLATRTLQQHPAPATHPPTASFWILSGKHKLG